MCVWFGDESYISEFQHPRRPEELTPPGAGVQGSHELQDKSAGN